MTNVAEWIALGVVVVAVTGFLSYLVWLKALALRHPKRDIWRGLIMVWLCLAATIVVLAGARALLGGPIVSYSAGAGGLHLSWDRPGDIFTSLSLCATCDDSKSHPNLTRVSAAPLSKIRNNTPHNYDHHCNNPLDIGSSHGRFLGVRFTD